MAPPAHEPHFEIRARRGHPDFLDLPWDEPLDEWTTDRLIPMAHGISRHVVRFVAYGPRVYALKATEPAHAQREYDLLRELTDAKLPVVEPVGVVKGRQSSDGARLKAILVTRYLDFALPYRYLIGEGDRFELRSRLMDAGVVLLCRLHLEGFFWGDCSLNNILFRRDAGALMAYLVDAETGELQPTLADPMRHHDIEIARINIVGDLEDLIASGRIEPFDTVDVINELERRYHELWDELTRAEEYAAVDRNRIEERIRRIEQLGFDVSEVSIETTAGGSRLRMRPALLEEGHHARELERRTGLAVQENQARRFLADIASWQAFISEQAGKPVPGAVAAARWLAEVYEPRIAAVPEQLRDRLEPAELFHELLEHRWFLSQQAGHDIGTDEALADYVATVLSSRPAEQHVVSSTDADELGYVTPGDGPTVDDVAEEPGTGAAETPGHHGR